jgi:hypothetical protein
MEKLFNLFKELLIVHTKYKGIVCGYDESRFILAVETTNDKDIFFKRLSKHDNIVILDIYKDAKYRYVYENESEILKQMKKNEHQN